MPFIGSVELLMEVYDWQHDDPDVVDWDSFWEEMMHTPLPTNGGIT